MPNNQQKYKISYNALLDNSVQLWTEFCYSKVFWPHLASQGCFCIGYYLFGEGWLLWG